MTKTEFILQLRRALSGRMDTLSSGGLDTLSKGMDTLSKRMDSKKISEHAAYYEEYIEIQVRKGAEEEQVVESLGSPALLAKSILNAEYDSQMRLDGRTLFSLGTHIKSLCLDLGTRAGQKVKKWFEK